METSAYTASRPRRHTVSRSWKRAAWILLLVMVLLVLGLAGAVLYLVRRPIPPTNGTARLPGLAASVTVVRDETGIPHITAANQADVFRAQGYVMAQDRLWQMDLYRRTAAGRLSEIAGPAALDRDQFIRTFGLHRAAEQEWAALPSVAQAAVREYTAGVNAYLASHHDALPLEFTILGYQPAPWTPVDTVAIGKLEAWDVAANLNHEVVLADLQAQLGAARAASLLPAYPDGKPIIVQPSALAGDPRGTILPQRRSGLFGDADSDSLIGSNNWVVDGTLSADGYPLLADDPHLRQQNPAIWYAMHLRALDGSLDVAGVALPGAPGIIIGHNRDIAWGITDLTPDVLDVFVEHLDEADHPGQYEYMDQWLPLQVATETINVKGQAPVACVVRSTRHGPLFNSAYPTLKQPVALQWTGAQPGGLLLAGLKLDQAANWDQFHAALTTWDAPGQNFVYADRAGNIGYQATGRWPIRQGGNGQVPVAGWTGANEWVGFVPYEQMPRVYNPPTHYIVTANNRVTSPAYPYLINGYWPPWFRAERIQQMLSSKTQWTVDDFKALQYDTHNLIAVRVGTYLAALTGSDARLQQAAALFKNWGGDIRTESPVAALYEVTFSHMFTNTFVDELGPSLAASYRLHISTAPATLLYEMLADPNNVWWDDVTTPQRETRDDILRRSLHEAGDEVRARQGTDMGKWSWGALHTMTFAHPLGAIQPLDRLLNFGPFATPGDEFTVATGWFPGNNPYVQGSNASVRLITPTGNWDQTRLIFSPGESGQLGSPHWGDLTADYLQGRYRPLPWLPDQIRHNAEGTLILEP